ncbi:MAG: response regulator [Intestinibacter sp.]
MIKTIIVDDEPAVVSIIKYFVEKKNLPLDIVATASRGDEGIELIKKLNPQLVFLDIKMPVVDGFEVMKSVSNTKFIVITAFESFEYAQKSLRLGAKDIILKPIEFKQLTASINRVMGWKFTSNNTVNDIIQYIHSNYDKKIELKIIAANLYLSPDYISKLFKAHMGITINKYINKVRIDKAIELFDNKELSVKEVATMTGYDSLNNFYKNFKNATGKTPAMYLSENNK